MNVVDNLYKINRFWRSGKIDKAFLYEVVRSEFNDITGHINDRRILSVIGPRRVGKSTLLYQTADYLLKQGINPLKILFFSGDDMSLFTEKNTITDILEIYAGDILHENLEDLNENIYVFIDEVHKLKDWQLHLKSYYDRRYKIKFIISGSSSTHLFKGSNESLLGRIEDIYVLPLSLKQFAEFYAAYKDNSMDISGLNLLMPQKNLYSDVDSYYQILKANSPHLNEFKPMKNRIISEYLLAGGYPEYFETSNILIWQKRLVEDIIGRGLYRDIVGIYNIKSPDVLEKLVYFIASNSGQEFAFNTIAQTLSVDTVTVSNYISYLAQAFLIHVSNNYTGNTGKTIRKNKKLYILDSGIKNALMRSDALDYDEYGFLIENSCLRHAINYADKNNAEVYFWRSNGKEVDIVMDNKISLLPVEVKYRSDIKNSDLKGLENFNMEYNTEISLVITKDFLNKKDNIYYIPYWLME